MSARSANAKRQQRVYDGYQSADISAGLGSSMRKKSAAKSTAASPTRNSAATRKKSSAAAKTKAQGVVSTPPITEGRKVAPKKTATTRKKMSGQKWAVVRKKTVTTMLGNLEPSREPAPVVAAPKRQVQTKVEKAPPAPEKVTAEAVTKVASVATDVRTAPPPKAAKSTKALTNQGSISARTDSAPLASAATKEAPAKPKVLRYARGEGRKADRQRLGTNGSTPRVASAPSPLAGTMPREKMSVAAHQRAMAEEAFSRIAPGLSAASSAEEEPSMDKPQHRGGPPAFHRSEFQIRYSQQDQLATAIRLGKTKRDVRMAASELVEQFGKLPPDQAVLIRVLEIPNDALLEKALDELLELDGRGKVRQSPELMKAIRGIQSKSAVVRELVELLDEKLGS